MFSIFNQTYNSHAIFKNNSIVRFIDVNSVKHFTGMCVCILQTIDMVMKIENDFFPVIAGDLGSSVETANRYQIQLEEFTPMFKVGLILLLDN